MSKYMDKVRNTISWDMSAQRPLGLLGDGHILYDYTISNPFWKIIYSIVSSVSSSSATSPFMDTADQRQ